MAQLSQASIVTEDYPLPVQPASRRLQSVDLLRGILMILMALDHTRDFFSSAQVDPSDPVHSWAALYLTRWITHLCAPGFIALAGASVYLQRLRGKSSSQLGQLLLTRGVWLIFLEGTLISFGWSFHLPPPVLLQVIWTIGLCMIVLSALQWLPVAAVGAIGLVIIAGHNLLDPVDSSAFGHSLAWELLHVAGPRFYHGQPAAFELYPVLPWIGVICAGYAFGPLAAAPAERRQRMSATLGVVFLAVFSLLRLLHGYGDDHIARRLPTAGQTAMSFFQVQKYPPSLDYVLASFGFLLLMYTVLDWAVQRQWLTRLRGFLEVYGRVPFFYYVCHLYLIHGTALLAVLAMHGDWHIVIGLPMFKDDAPRAGLALPGVYLLWAAFILILYLPCRWFSRLKGRRRDWWLSYL